MSEHWVKVETIRQYDGWHVCRVHGRGLMGQLKQHPILVVSEDTLRDAPDDEQLRNRVAELERDLERAQVERDEEAEALSKRVDELTRKLELCESTNRKLYSNVNQLTESLDAIRRERDKAPKQCDECDEFRERAECAEAEAKRLSRVMDAWIIADAQLRDHAQARDLPCPTVDDVREAAERVRLEMEADDQPAPQTHYREGDLVGCGHKTFRLDAFISHIGDGENWHSKDSCTGSVAPTPGAHPILERDGVPTDKGLERLAERAGCELRRNVDPGLGGFAVEERNVWIAQQLTDDDRRALAAALREMGGA